jgi:hypothetical protein
LSIKYEYSLDVDGINELFNVRNFLIPQAVGVEGLAGR